MNTDIRNNLSLRIALTGGCGYTGSVLTKKLLMHGFKVTVIDTMWFGNYLPPHSNLEIIKSDIGDVKSFNLKGFDSLIHLANIANDPGVELNQTLSWEVNVLGSQLLIERAIEDGVKQIIYASSGSVYGIKYEDRVTEELELVPISTYNKTKMVSERVILSYLDNIAIHIIRPATVCGLSPRMRFDVSVNLLTLQAFKNSKLTVFGGDQIRPNIHIDDLTDVYIHFIENPTLSSGVYNAGFENLSILNIANLVASKIKTDIEIIDSNDPRSYRLDSSKLLKTGFAPKKTVSNAIDEILDSLKSNEVSDRPEWQTVKWMQKIGLG